MRDRTARAATSRVLVMAAVLLGLAPGCTHAASRLTGPGLVRGLTELQDVRPCPGIPAFGCGSLSVRLDPFGPAAGRLSLRVATATSRLR